MGGLGIYEMMTEHSPVVVERCEDYNGEDENSPVTAAIPQGLGGRAGGGRVQL